MSYLVPPAELPLAPYMKEHKKGAPTLFTGVTDEERKASVELETTFCLLGNKIQYRHIKWDDGRMSV